MPKYILKNKKYSIKTNKPIEYVNGKWMADGKRIGDWTLSQLQIKDSDGYYKTPLPNGTLAVQDVDDNGNPIKINYIGGTAKESRNKYWKQAPIMRHATDSIANIYDISPELLRNRLDAEGYTDNRIQLHNNTLRNNKNENKLNRDYSNYTNLNRLSGSYDGTNQYGLDDVFTYIEQGDVIPTPDTNYFDHYFINEKGRKTHAVTGETTKDNIDLTAATLKFMRDEAKKDFPKASRIFLDEAAGIYYNRGISGGKQYIKRKYNK